MNGNLFAVRVKLYVKVLHLRQSVAISEQDSAAAHIVLPNGND
jgi:hypothetical protein